MAAQASASQINSAVGDKKKAVGSRSPIFLAAMRKRRERGEKKGTREGVGLKAAVSDRHGRIGVWMNNNKAERRRG